MHAGGKRITGSEVCSLVTFYMAQFEKGRKTNKGQQQARQNKWDPPSEDMYKINIDGAFRAATSQGEDGDLLQGTMSASFWRVGAAIFVEWPPLFKLKLLLPCTVWRE